MLDTKVFLAIDFKGLFKTLLLVTGSGLIVD
jgi:hypothetical protein